MGEKYVTVADAALILNLHPSRVRRLLHAGRLEAYPCCPVCGQDVTGRELHTPARGYVLPLSAVEEYRDRPLPNAANEKRRRAARALKESEE